VSEICYCFFESTRVSCGARSGTIGAGRRGWMPKLLDEGGESKCVTTTSPRGFSGASDVAVAGPLVSSSSPWSFRRC
jgi:hypothetical protein